ncbi:LPD38 domain-containing protein, partial [Castellaniella sp.]
LASVVERGTELAFGGDDFRLKDFAKQVYAILDDQLELGISSLAPQMFMPAIEASFNYDTFRQRNIDNMAQERLPAGERFTTSTSAGAIALGRALDVSPQRIEHLASGYFGWLGVQALNVADYLVRPLSNLPENPRRDITRIDNIFVVGDFVKEPNARSSKYIQRFYDMQKEVNQVYAAYNQARATGDMERASDLSRSDEARLYGLARGANKEMTKITQRIRALERDHRPMDEKRAQLDELYRLRNQLAAITDQRARALQ